MSNCKHAKGISRRNFIKGTLLGAGAMTLSGLDASASPMTEAPKEWNLEADVLVMGAGGTGLVSAIEAVEAGATVIVLEKAPIVGGTTALSGAVIQASETEFQKAAGVTGDSTEAHYQFWMRTGEGIADPELVKVMAENGPKNIQWLVAHGLTYINVYGVDPIPYMDEDIMKPRIHVPGGGAKDYKPGSGRNYVELLHGTAKKKGVRFILDTQATALIQDAKSRVIGLRAQQNGKVILCKAKRGVVISSGGMDRNKDMARSFSPQQLWALENGRCYAVPTNTGDGIRMAMAVGADLAGMGGTIGTPIHPVGTAMVFRGNPMVPGIWVNQYGQRFVNEAAHYAYVMRAVFDQEAHMAWAIFDESGKSKGGKAIGGHWKPLSHDLSKEIADGSVKTGTTPGELADVLGIDASQLETTIERWNQDTTHGKDTLFHKKVGLEPLKRAPFYAKQITEVNLGSCGGLKINGKGQVKNVNGLIIPGLYAGGMAAGGFIGPYYPGSGTAIASTVCFGRIAGRNAASEKPWE